MRAFFFLLSVLVAMPLEAANDFEREQIRQRIQPIGTVTLEQTADPVATQEMAVAEKEETKSSAQEIYQQYCQVCHQGGLAGAPKFRDRSDWQAKLDQKGIEGLTETAMKGLNAMPPKGTCFQCSEADIQAAVEYMVPQ